MNTQNKPDSGAAFPSPETDHLMGECGMSLRDYFAGQALNGMLASGHGGDSMEFAKLAYGLADAMIAERSK